MEKDEKEILGKINDINSWDDWGKFQEKYFDDSKLVERNNEKSAERLNREDQIIDGVTWHAASCSYKDLDLYFLYQKMSDLVFRKLEPEADADNATHPEWYGKICYRCEQWTRNYEHDTCPICSGELLSFPLNEDE